MARSIRVAETADFHCWLRMRREVFQGLSGAFHRQEMELYHRDPTKSCFVARLVGDGDPVGFVEASLRNVVDGCLTSPVGYIEGVYVTPEARGQGCGRALVQHAIAWFREQGCSELATDALVEDKRAQRFHREMGFRETYRIVQFKREIGTAEPGPTAESPSRRNPS